jgi:hypothetical protein
MHDSSAAKLRLESRIVSMDICSITLFSTYATGAMDRYCGTQLKQPGTLFHAWSILVSNEMI